MTDARKVTTAEIELAREIDPAPGSHADSGNIGRWNSYFWVMSNAMVVTTTNSVEGRSIKSYLGVVTGEAILGANIFRDMFAGIRDIVGGRSASYEKELRNARETAMAEMRQAAAELGANAIVGIDLDYEVLGQNNGMLMVSISGTAVIIS